MHDCIRRGVWNIAITDYSGTAPLSPSCLHWLHRMATSGETSDEEEDEEKLLEAQIRQLRRSKKEMFERTRSANEQLERISGVA